MQRSTTFKILIVLAGVLVVAFSWILIRDARNRRIENTPPYTGIENPFGFDDTDVDIDGDPADPSTAPSDVDGEAPSPQPGQGGGIVVIQSEKPLVKLSDVAVAGYTFVSKERIIETPASTTPTTGIVETYDFSGYKTIRFGDKTEEVIAIKTVLNRETPSPALVISDEYDTDMKNAVVDFQNKKGLSGDGVIGPKTYQMLNAAQGITGFSSAPKKDPVEVVEFVRYVDAGSGIMFDQTIRKQEKAVAITTSPVPGVAEAFFDATGTKAILRYLKEGVIETYLVSLEFPTIDPKLSAEERAKIDTTAKVSGEFLPQNIRSLDVSADKKSFAFLQPVSGGVALMTQNFATKQKKQVFESMFTDWLVDYASAGKISLTTRASGLVEGFSYSVETSGGAMRKSVGGRLGLTALMSPDGKKVLAAEYKDGALATTIFDLANGKATPVSPSALPEKCVWTLDSSHIYCAAPIRSVSMVYPDDWYKGLNGFDDAIWDIEVAAGIGNIVYDIFAKTSERIDATNLYLNTSEDFLGFINKNDGILWGYDLNK